MCSTTTAKLKQKNLRDFWSTTTGIKSSPGVGSPKPKIRKKSISKVKNKVKLAASDTGTNPVRQKILFFQKLCGQHTHKVGNMLKLKLNTNSNMNIAACLSTKNGLGSDNLFISSETVTHTGAGTDLESMETEMER